MWKNSESSKSASVFWDSIIPEGIYLKDMDLDKQHETKIKTVGLTFKRDGCRDRQ